MKRNHLIITLLTLIMLVIIPQTSSADSNGVIGKLDSTSYTSLAKLVDALKSNYKNKKVTIEMMGNWNAAGSDDFDRRLVIPT